MKRTLLLLITVLVISSAQAHYYGFGGTALASLGGGTGYLLGLQLGGPVGSGLELRGTLDTVLITSNLGFDLLYPFALSSTTQGYVGGGADFFYQLLFASVSAPSSSSGTFGFHGTIGLEYRPNTVGVYGELQPYSLPGKLFAVKARAGVNIYF